jgi:hypothetical protein
MKKFLVAARIDRGRKSVSHERIEVLAQHTPAFAKLIRNELDKNEINIIEVNIQAKSYPHITE